jgi:hypothetical protein
MWLMDEPNMVGQAVNPLPVDRRGAVVANNVGGITKNIDLVVVTGTDHLVTGRTESYRWYSGVRLRRNSAVTERAVHAETFHGLAIGCNPVEGQQRCVDSVREIDRLIEGLLETKDGHGLAEPPCDDESCDNTHNRYYAEATNGQHRHEHLRQR